MTELEALTAARTLSFTARRDLWRRARNWAALVTAGRGGVLVRRWFIWNEMRSMRTKGWTP